MSDSANKRSLNILLICDSYPPVLGGSEIEAQRVCSALIRRGHRVRVLCSGGTPMPPQRDWVDPCGVPVSILTKCSHGRRKDIVFAIQVAWNIWRARRSCDVVYFLMQGLHLATGLPVARYIHKPIIMKISGSGIIPILRNSRAGRLELGWLRKWAARVMVLNDGMIEEAVAAGLPRHLLSLMPNPVDVDVFRPPQSGEAAEWRHKHGIPLTAVVVIYVGRISPEKGLRGLLRGFAHAVPNAPEMFLLLVGDGAMLPELQAAARDLGLNRDRVRFIGRVPVDEVPAWLRTSDVFALTSPNEGFSCALVEAMAVGLAVVVSDIAANLQLVDPEVHGLVTPCDNERSIGEALRRLSHDPQLRRRLGEAAHQRVLANFSTDRVVAQYEELFAEVIKDQ